MVTKEPLFVSQRVRLTGLLCKLYDSLCLEKFDSTYAMVLYSKMQWFSINMRFERFLEGKYTLLYLPIARVYEGEPLKFDPSFMIRTS